MSFSWRERLQRAKRRIMQDLELAEEDWDYIWENITSFCSESDAEVRLVYGDKCDVDQKVDEMYEDEFLEHAEDILRKVLKRLGYKKKGKKEAEEEAEEEEEEEESDDDSDSDSDSDSEGREQEQAQEIEN